MTTKFEVGKTYTHGWACNADAHTSWTVLKRTPKTVTIKNLTDGETKNCRVKTMSRYGVGEYEYVLPFGRFSMAPVLDATDFAG